MKDNYQKKGDRKRVAFEINYQKFNKSTMSNMVTKEL